MNRLSKHLLFLPLIAALMAPCVFAQQKALTWQEVLDKFEAANPTLHAGQIGIDESKANETTAYLRPNPSLSLLADQIDPFPGGPSHGAFAYWLPSATLTYLHERQHKRELRLESAKEATGIAVSNQADLERNLIFNLRSAFVQTLQQKAVRDLAKDNLDYYDHLLGVNRDRFQRRRHRAGRSGPAGIAARAVRVRLADRRSESADGEDSAADAAQRRRRWISSM